MIDERERELAWARHHVASAEDAIADTVEHLASRYIRVTGIDVNDDGSVVILWQPEGDDDGIN